jgi:hypothetical protein
MGYTDAIVTYQQHKVRAHASIALVAIVVALLEPFGMGALEELLFLIVAEVTFLDGLVENAAFSGYGVAKDIHSVSEAFSVILSLPVSEFAWEGFAVRPLVRRWARIAAGSVLLALASILLNFTIELPEHVAALSVTFSAARIIALLGELYVWFLGNRLLLWYLPETHFREMLSASRLSKMAIEALVEKVRDQNLLLR